MTRAPARHRATPPHYRHGDAGRFAPRARERTEVTCSPPDLPPDLARRLKVCRYCQALSPVARLKMASKGLGGSGVASRTRDITSSPGSAYAHTNEHHEFNPASDSRDFWDV